VSNPSSIIPRMCRRPKLPEKPKLENTHQPCQSQHSSPGLFNTGPLNCQPPNPQSKDMPLRWPGACQSVVAAGVMNRSMFRSEAGFFWHVMIPPRVPNSRISCHCHLLKGSWTATRVLLPSPGEYGTEYPSLGYCVHFAVPAVGAVFSSPVSAGCSHL
jgi:hypothetical protein